jgi:hypothetical protein
MPSRAIENLAKSPMCFFVSVQQKAPQHVRREAGRFNDAPIAAQYSRRLEKFIAASP